jgi:hypothetical protein
LPSHPPFRLRRHEGDHRHIPFCNNALAAKAKVALAAARRPRRLFRRGQAADQDIDGKDYPGE